MSCSDYIARLSVQKEKTLFIVIPVYPARCFRYGCITVDRCAGIRTPKDLEGKRVGLPGCTMTATVWIRGILQHEFSVDLSKIHWIEGQINGTGLHGEPGVMPLLREVPITVNQTDRSLSDLIDTRDRRGVRARSVPVWHRGRALELRSLPAVHGRARHSRQGDAGRRPFRRHRR